MIMFVRDILMQAEDCDHIRIWKQCGSTSHMIASGEWYCDSILDMSDKVVKSCAYDEDRAFLDIFI